MWKLKFVVTTAIIVTGSLSSSGSVSSYHPSTTKIMAEGLSSLSSTSTLAIRNHDCIIVGGGPVGLAAALTLSNEPHCMNVILLEKSKRDTDSGGNNNNNNKKVMHDPTRSYSYNINERGLQWFYETGHEYNNSSVNNTNHYIPTQKHLRKALEKLQTIGTFTVRGIQNVVMIPGMPNIPITVPKDVVAMRSSLKLVSERTNYRIARHQIMELLEECCLEQESERQKLEKTSSSISPRTGSIQLLSGKCVVAVEVDDMNDTESNNTLNVLCQDGSVYSGALVVAADGIDSAVRRSLAGANNNNRRRHNSSSGGSVEGNTIFSSRTSRTPTNDWLQSKSKSFRLRRYKSPSTGLILKALQFSSKFKLQNTDGSIIPTQPDTVYFINSIHTGSRNTLKLVLIPMKDDTIRIRPAFTTTRPDHEIWTLQTAAQCKEWFMKAFPRVPFDDWIDDENEWERFLNANGTVFPYCQYSPGSAVSSPDGLTGVVLVGDACHAFPPDIGQGINAGLQDVVALDRSLRGLDTTTGQVLRQPPTTIGEALASYGANRRHEHAALIRLARFGAPYQYQQPWRRDKIGAILWRMNLLLRQKLNKYSFGLIPVAAIQLSVHNRDWTFRKIMQYADTTTFVLRVICFLPIIIMILSRLFLK